jgi:hypothetical protein
VVTSIGVDADGLVVAGVLALDGALAPLAGDDGPDAAAGPDADDEPPEAVDGSELELPPLHPPMIAAMATAVTPTDKCPFICGSPFTGLGPGAVAIIVCAGLTREKIVGRRLGFGGTMRAIHVHPSLFHPT